MIRGLRLLGKEGLYYLGNIGRMAIFLLRCIFSLLLPPYKVRSILQQVHFVGVKSLFVILFTGAFTGMVLGLQGYYTLTKFGSEGFLGAAVALSLVRELGPVLTALMVIGRAGSAITAEIGIMRNSEQIDALECMAIDPYAYLLAPKYAGTLISVPLLTLCFDVIGIIGGYAVGVGLFGVNKGAYFQGMYSGVVWQDLEMGLIKSLVFALLIVWIATVKGYYLHRDRSGGFGAVGVSRATTSAVVIASVNVLVWDYLLSAWLL